MSVVATVLEVLVGLAFAGSGGRKLAGSESTKGEFERFGYPARFVYLIGVLEL